MQNHSTTIILQINNKDFEFDVTYNYEPAQHGDFNHPHFDEVFEVTSLRHHPVNCEFIIDALHNEIVQAIKAAMHE
jgi:hypothetical protein